MFRNFYTINSDPGLRRRARLFLAIFAAAFAAAYVLALIVRLTALSAIPPQISGNPSLDYKLAFLKGRDYGREPVSLAIGSSMAVNNLGTDDLQRGDGMTTINLGVWGTTLQQDEMLYAIWDKRFNVRQVTLAVQMFEAIDRDEHELEIHPDKIEAYLADSPLFWATRPFDILDAITRKRVETPIVRDPQLYTYVGFTETGAVPLQIGKAHIDPKRWWPQTQYTHACHDCMAPLLRLCRRVTGRGIPFLTVIPPYREAVHPTFHTLAREARGRINRTMQACGGRTLRVEDYASFDDSCFVDWAHLNADGVKKAAALLIAWKKSSLPKAPRRIVCQPPL